MLRFKLFFVFRNGFENLKLCLSETYPQPNFRIFFNFLSVTFMPIHLDYIISTESAKSNKNHLFLLKSCWRIFFVFCMLGSFFINSYKIPSSKFHFFYHFGWKKIIKKNSRYLFFEIMQPKSTPKVVSNKTFSVLQILLYWIWKKKDANRFMTLLAINPLTTPSQKKLWKRMHPFAF